jgi:hypothetical protein
MVSGEASKFWNLRVQSRGEAYEHKFKLLRIPNFGFDCNLYFLSFFLISWF